MGQVTSELLRVVESSGWESQNKQLCTIVKRIEDNISKLQIFITQAGDAQPFQTIIKSE